MLIILSPAKGLDFDTKATTNFHTVPDFVDESTKLIAKLKTLSRKKIGELMSISPNLAGLNHERYHQWEPEFSTDSAKQALFAFQGDVYRGLRVSAYSQEDLEYTQNHLRILSGLHGLLRPMDLIRPYRLEMGTRLPVRRKKNLYQFWDGTITEAVNTAMAGSGNQVLVNLASNEYYKAVNAKEINGRIITPHFREAKGGDYKVVMTFAKLARGLMTSYILQNRIEEPEGIKGFNINGYGYNERLSSENDWVFTREEGNWPVLPF